MSGRDPYELETPRRARDDEGAGRRSRRLRTRLLRGSARARRTEVRSRMHRPGAHWQRSTVKISFRKNTGSGQWRAHGRYIARESSRPDRENRGLGFDAERDDLNVPATLAGWEKTGDALLWKVVVSPENGHRMDLEQHARDLVGRMESHLRTRLEWVAVEHNHSAHPHVHLAIRGVREHGSALGIDDAFIKHGIRTHSRDLATRELGPRTEQDRIRAREAGVHAHYVGALDHAIDAEAGVARQIRFHHEPSRNHPRHQVWRRLGVLEELGLATREANTWTVARDLRPALRHIQKLRDVHRSLTDPAISLSEPRPTVRVTEIAPGRRITGRVAGALLDEASDRPHILLEGTDGLLHLIRQTPGMERRRGEGGLAVGTVVTLEGRTFQAEDGSARAHVAIAEHGSLDELRLQERLGNILDQHTLRSVRETGHAVDVEAGRSRFSRQFLEAARDRLGRLVAAGLVLETQQDDRERSYRLAQGVQLDMEAQAHDRERTPLHELRSHSDKPVREAPDQPGQKLRGVFREYAIDAEGQSYAVLESGSRLTAVRSDRSDLEVGHEYEAQSAYERSADRRRVLTWQFEDLERLRELERATAHRSPEKNHG